MALLAVGAVALVPAFAGAGGQEAAPTVLTANPFIGVAVPPVHDGNVSATLQDEEENAIAGKTITFEAGGTEICSGATNDSGVASCTPSEDGLVALVTNQGYVASFEGDAEWAASSAEGRLIA